MRGAPVAGTTAAERSFDDTRDAVAGGWVAYLRPSGRASRSHAFGSVVAATRIPAASAATSNARTETRRHAGRSAGSFCISWAIASSTPVGRSGTTVDGGAG